MHAKSPPIERLGDLVQLCCDGEQGYKLAASAVDDAQLRTRFIRYAGERASFARELKNQVTRLGGTPAEEGHVKALAHRGWMRLHSRISDVRNAIVAECARGEDIALTAYDAALSRSSDEPTRELLVRQRREVKRAHDRLDALQTVAV